MYLYISWILLGEAPAELLRANRTNRIWSKKYTNGQKTNSALNVFLIFNLITSTLCINCLKV